jgi:hypothetical protein
MYWANGMTKPAVIQLPKDLYVLFSAVSNVTSMKDTLWTHLSQHFASLFPDLITNDACDDVEQLHIIWNTKIRLRGKNRLLDDDNEWITLDDPLINSNSDNSKLSTSDDRHRPILVEELHLGVPIPKMDDDDSDDEISEDDEDFGLLLIECLYYNLEDPSDKRNGLFFMSDVEDKGWRIVLKEGDYIDAQDSAGGWYAYNTKL